MNDIALTGCTPDPLMSYLKALGIFRLVAEQSDASARLSWHGGTAVLHTALDRDGLVKFFLEEYRPTPIVVPWSGGDFFGINDSLSVSRQTKSPTSTKIIEALLATSTPRLDPYRETVRSVMRIMASCGIRVKADIEGASRKAAKSAFVDHLRSELPDSTVFWIDAAAQAEADGTSFNPLLGSGGGNDGNTHFSDNFMQNLWDCLPDFDSQRKNENETRPSVRNALFDELDGVLVERTGALYDSGAVGGPNATQGFIRAFQVNPWNFILALEGTLAFAGGIAKRQGTFSRESPSFPFIAQMIAAGFGSAALKEYGQNEVWLPIWARPWTYSEHQHLMREGRVQLGRRPARTGTDFARSIRTLGVSAGIDEFKRYGLIRGRVGGENYYTAAVLGCYRVGYDSSVSLLDQLEPWLNKFTSAIRDDNVPARYRSAFNQLDAAIDELCRGQHDKALQSVLRQIGKVERLLATGLAFAKKQGISPIKGLSGDWLTQADDTSTEFRLAASLAGIRGHSDVGPLRYFLEEVNVKKYLNWSPGSTSAVWSKQPLASNLAAVFRRRQMEAFRAGIAGVPLDSAVFARLDDVIAFLNEETDDEKLSDLLWGLIGVEFPTERTIHSTNEFEIPFEFGVPRLLVKMASYTANGDYWNLADSESDANAKPDPDVFHLLASGRSDAVGASVDRAARRLKSGGLLVTGYRNRYQSGKPLGIVSTISPSRLLAAMLFPLSNRDLERIANAVLYPPETED